jgi:PAS domain-containing protein
MSRGPGETRGQEPRGQEPGTAAKGEAPVELLSEREQLRRRLIQLGDERDRMTREVQGLRAEMQELRAELSRVQSSRTSSGDLRLSPLREEDSWEMPETQAAPLLPAPRTGAGSGRRSVVKEQGADLSRRLRPEEFEAMPFGLLVLDQGGRVLRYQDDAQRLPEVSRGNLVGQGFFTQVAPALRDYAEEFLREAQDPRRVFVKTFDFLCTLPEGEAHVAVIVSPGRQQGQYYVAIARRLVMPR